MPAPRLPARARVLAATLAAGFLPAPAPLLAQLPGPSPVRAPQEGDPLPEEFQGVDIVEKSGERVPLDLQLIDSTGQPMKLGELFNDGAKPVVLALVYFRCPLVCPLILQNLTATLNELDLRVGDKFNVAVVTFDPAEGPEAAAVQKAVALSGYESADPAAVERSWRFLTGPGGAARQLADAVGFKYKYIAQSGEYNHPTAIMVLTPDGRVSRYVYGVKFPAKTVRMALLEASDGQIGTTVDRIVMWCFHWDPNSGAYVLQAFRAMQVGAVLSAIAVAGILAGMVYVERRRRRLPPPLPPSPLVHSPPSPPAFPT